eukprot:m.334765 g.334765  ORF g.334765 m.334765 type:complete len:736 (-) comp17432_c0_seq1:179-2386(-)
MFWKSAGWHQSSAIDTILEKNDYTLEELLDDEDVLQECRSQHEELNKFLSSEAAFNKMLDYVIKEPAGSPDDRLRFKYPNVASEILTAETPGILQLLCTEETFNKILTVLDYPAPINPLIASYFTKLFALLLVKAPDMVFERLNKDEELFFKLISHIGTSAIMDLLRRMTMPNPGDEHTRPFDKIVSWLANEKQLVKILMSLFNIEETGADETILKNAAILLQDIINDSRREAIEMQNAEESSVFLSQIISMENLGPFLSIVLGSSESFVIQQGVTVLFTLLEDPKQLLCMVMPEGEEEEAQLTELDQRRYNYEIESIMNALKPQIEHIKNLLNYKPIQVDSELNQTAPRFGRIRLTATKLVETLIKRGEPDISEQILNLDVIKILLEHFERFSDNNFLHLHVLNVIDYILALSSSESETQPQLLSHLVKDCKLPQTLVRMYNTNLTAEEQNIINRKGYMGHVIKAAQTLVSCFNASKDLYEMLGEDKDDWEHFRESYLEKDIDRWKLELGGGKPVFNSDDDDVDDMAALEMSSPARSFREFLMQPLSVDPPTSLTGDNDDNDSDDEISGSYNLDGGALFNFSSGFSADDGGSGEMTDVKLGVQDESTNSWMINDSETNPGDDNAEVGDGTIVLKKIDPFANNDDDSSDSSDDEKPGVQPENPLGNPVDVSTPTDAPETGWANFDAFNGPNESETDTTEEKGETEKSESGADEETKPDSDAKTVTLGNVDQDSAA